MIWAMRLGNHQKNLLRPTFERKCEVEDDECEISIRFQGTEELLRFARETGVDLLSDEPATEEEKLRILSWMKDNRKRNLAYIENRKTRKRSI